MRADAVLLLALFLMIAPDAAGQQSGDVAAAREAYEALDFAAADSLAAGVIAAPSRFSPDDLVEAHKLRAFVALARNDREVARANLRSALSIDPGLSLDPRLTSPNVLEFFREVKAGFSGNIGAGESTVRYIEVSDPRPNAALRSLVLPGWGQLYKGQRTRGLVLLGAWGGLTAATAAAHIIRQDREEAYLATTDPLKIPDRFDDFNRWHKVRNNLAVAGLAVWVVGYVDALVKPVSPRMELSVRPPSTFDESVPTIFYTLHF